MVELRLVRGIEGASSRQRFQECGVTPPSFFEFAGSAPDSSVVLDSLTKVDPDAVDETDLERGSFFTRADPRMRATLPEHVVLRPTLTGVGACRVTWLAEFFNVEAGLQ